MGSENETDKKIKILKEEIERLEEEKKKQSEEETEIKKIDEESKRAWLNKQRKSIDSTLDKIQEHYEKEFGIEDK